MVKLFTSRILRFFILVTVSMLIHIFFVADSVYCEEDTINDAVTSSNDIGNSTQKSNSSDIRVSKPLVNTEENTLLNATAKTAGAITESAVKNAPWDTGELLHGKQLPRFTKLHRLKRK